MSSFSLLDDHDGEDAHNHDHEEKPQVRSAIALNSIGTNMDRAIGPALGGVLLASFGVRHLLTIDEKTSRTKR